MWETVLAIGGAIVLAGNVGAVIYKVIKPSFDIRKDIHDLKQHDKKDFEQIQMLQDMSRAQCKMLLVIIDHMIDGNHVDKMKKTREEIIDLITDEQILDKS